ncbi:molybdate ABC transporter substrate-binding protein [Paenibacillus sp. D51F]
MLRSKKIKPILFLLAGLMLLVAAACGSKQTNTQPDSSGGTSASASPPASSVPLVELTVSAAASLTGALDEIKTAFEAAHPSISLHFNLGASGTLQKQIEQGAPADLFLSASSKNMKALVDQNFVAAEDSRDLLGNSLVVIVPKEASPNISSLDALAGQAFSKIAIGIPESVPAGQYAQEALAKAGQWDALKDKLVQAKDVKAVLQAVETGNADAGFVYRTDALSSAKAAVAYEVDPASYPSIRYPAAIVKATKHRPEAERFYTYLQSEDAMAVFKNYGFTDPK